MPNEHDDFSDATRKIIKRLAGGKCSKCQVKTTTHDGFGVKNVKVGEAAHIEGSRLGSPRFNPEDSSEHRRSSKNGIWLCAACHSEIDNGNAQMYDALFLFELKVNQMEKVKYELFSSKKPNDDIEKAFWLVEYFESGGSDSYNLLTDLYIEPNLLFCNKKLNEITVLIDNSCQDSKNIYLRAMELYSKNGDFDQIKLILGRA